MEKRIVSYTCGYFMQYLIDGKWEFIGEKLNKYVMFLDKDNNNVPIITWENMYDEDWRTHSSIIQIEMDTDYEPPCIMFHGELKQFAGSPIEGSGDYYLNDVDSEEPLYGRGIFG